MSTFVITPGAGVTGYTQYKVNNVRIRQQEFLTSSNIVNYEITSISFG